MSFTIRPVRDEDDLDVINAANPSWFGGEMTRKLFAAGPDDEPTTMVVAEVDGEPVGYAHAVGRGVNDGFRGMGYVFVQPDHRRQGIGAALFEEVKAVCTPERVRGIQLAITYDDQASLGVAAAHGCTLAGTHLESELQLDDLGPVLARVSTEVEGVRIAPLPDDLDEDGWHGFADTLTRLMADTPDQAEGAEPMPYPILRAMVVQPWQALCAWRNDAIVGLTCVMVRNEAAGRLNTVLTAVDRDLRGQGLATALKVSHAVALRDRGFSTIVTQNMEGNDAILAVNTTMGFRRSGGHREANYDYR